jgi:hypothetical protein
MIETPLANLTPTRHLWVSTQGNDANDGSESAPLSSIQAAVDRATPGTAIMVKAGTYEENLNLSGLRGNPGEPIVLVSADGPQAAKIVGGPKAATITGHGISNVGIYDFHVVANAGKGDIGGFKLWGPWENPAENLVVAGNLITGKGQDGFKLFGGAKNNLVLGNTIDGEWRQEAIDNVSVEDTVYAYNTVRGSAGHTAITMKAGSRDMQVIGNDIDIDAGTAVFVGGMGNSRLSRSFPDYWEGFEAKNVAVEGNSIDANAKSVSFIGATESSVAGNHLADEVGSLGHAQKGHFSYDSHDNAVTGNAVETDAFFKPSEGQDGGYVVSGNVVGGGAPDVGADSATGLSLQAALRVGGGGVDLAALVTPPGVPFDAAAVPPPAPEPIAYPLPAPEPVVPGPVAEIQPPAVPVVPAVDPLSPDPAMPAIPVVPFQDTGM